MRKTVPFKVTPQGRGKSGEKLQDKRCQSWSAGGGVLFNFVLIKETGADQWGGALVNTRL